MGQISLSLPADGTTIEAADVNTPFNTLLNEFNGNIDNDNIKSGAAISGTKILTNSLPPTTYDANARAGWNTGILSAPNTITCNGNGSYSVVFNTTDLTSYISPGMRIRSTRTIAAPTKCTSLNGSTQYLNKTSPAGTTFTDDFVAMAWIKVSSYTTGITIASRFNGTSGWRFTVESSGQISLIGYNGGGANKSYVLSSQSIPLNKWIHVAAQLDMSSFTATTSTSYVMINGLDVPATVARAGTNPTALIQAGNLEIGSDNAGNNFFNGKLAQVAYFSAKIAQATILTYISQGLSGSETSLVSAYSFNNVITDLNTGTGNDLSAQASAAATNADSPFGGQADGTVSSTLDYGIVTSAVFSTNTTLTIQVPEGCTIPTSGGVSAVAYSSLSVPYGFTKDPGKWTVTTDYQDDNNVTSIAQVGGHQISLPVGSWILSMNAGLKIALNGNNSANLECGLSTATGSFSDIDLAGFVLGAAVASLDGSTGSNIRVQKNITVSSPTIYYQIAERSGATLTCAILGSNQAGIISAVCAYL